MTPLWIRESPPHWDDDKATIIGGAPAGTFDFDRVQQGDLLPGEWWRVEQDGRVVGYGWMDTGWGEGEVLLAVDQKAHRRGLGSHILDRLEREAVAAGLNYIHNVVRPSNPRREAITRWLQARGFQDAGDGRLKRRVGPPGRDRDKVD